MVGYSSWLRGDTANVLGREIGAWVRVPPLPPNETQDIQPPRGVFWVMLIEYQTIIVMAECSINAVRHN